MVTTSTNISVDKMHEATLSNADGFTAFSFRGYNIRFKAPYSLERYTDVVKWEDGLNSAKLKIIADRADIIVNGYAQGFFR